MTAKISVQGVTKTFALGNETFTALDAAIREYEEKHRGGESE